MAENSLTVQWTSDDAASGLLRAIIDVPAPGKGSHFKVEVDGHTIWSAPVVLHADDRLHVNLHTHLIDNGIRHITVAIENDGARHEHTRVIDVQNTGRLADRTRVALANHQVPIVFLGDCDASYYEQPQLDHVHWIDAPDPEIHILNKLDRDEITATEAELLRRFVRDGFVVLDAALPEEMVLHANEALDTAIEQQYQGYQYGDSTRLEQMHTQFDAIREIWLYAPIHRFLSLIFDAPSQPCQSLVYVFGSQQDAHQDTIHLTPFPAGMMCGVWIALEDVRPDSGELVVYPGSHRLPRVYMKDAGSAKVRGDWTEFGEKVVGYWAELLRDSGIQPMPYLAKRGDILIWHENLMHAGSRRRDPSLSRRSVVTHNFAKGCIVYYDSSGNVGHVHDFTNRK